MNKSAVKTYAIWARNKLIADIVTKAGLMGITEDGIADALPQSTKDVKFFDIGTKDYASLTGDQIRQRAAFVSAIRAKEREGDYKSAFQFVVEKIAYTWFNRLIAIRFMEVNDYLPSHVRVLSSENSNKAEPDMVTKPFDTDLTFTNEEQDYVLKLKDENRLDELFRWLFIKQCHKLNEILPLLFEPESNYARETDYLDLLLTISFTDKDGVVWRLVHDIKEQDFRIRTPEDDERQKVEQIPEEEMPAGQVQIIGWLYQYYNSEPKDKVFADLKKNIKISKDKIPAATQLFTPDWIVRYMVENSLGRLWVEGHPNEELKQNWKYYLEEAEQEPEVQAQLEEIRKGYATLRPEEIKVIDPCMGSGHILVYLFDVLMQIYQSQGWQAREAAASIVQNNLWGLDIDERAAQLAYFAVMMKARQYDRRFFSRGIQPHVYAIPESYALPKERLERLGPERAIAETLINDFRDGKEFGSILTPHVTLSELEDLRSRLDQIDEMSDYGSLVETVVAFEISKCLRPLIDVAQALVQKYDVVVTNPPYMSIGSANKKLNEFVKKHYPDSKSDFFAVFIERCGKMTKKNCYQAMITQHSWMFLSRYEKMRNSFNSSFINMIHLGARAFDEISGEVVQTVAFVVIPSRITDYFANYIRLVGFQNELLKEKEFFNLENRFVSKQSRFMSIPGSTVAYWSSQNVLNDFEIGTPLKMIAVPRVGIITGNNERFIKYWYEIVFNNINFSIQNYDESKQSDFKWYPYNKGGSIRNWFGNRELVVWFRQGGEDIISNAKETGCFYFLGAQDVFFKEGITWNGLASNKNSFRFSPSGSLFDSNKGPMLFPKTKEEGLNLLALFNTKVTQYFLNILNPSISLQAGDFEKLPILPLLNDDIVRGLCKENINCAKNDWDSFETSWDFQKHPLI